MSYVGNRVCELCGSRSPWNDICGECEVAARVSDAFEAELEELRARAGQIVVAELRKVTAERDALRDQVAELHRLETPDGAP